MEEERRQGFELLFDGTRESFAGSFTKYVKNDSTPRLIDSVWVIDPSDQCIFKDRSAKPIRSRKKYLDFDLRLDFRVQGEDGLLYRVTLEGDALWQTGLEYALTNNIEEGKDSPGAAYDLFAPHPNAYHPFETGKWNSMRLVAQGDSIEHWMNDVKVLGFRMHNEAYWKAYTASKWNASNTMSLKRPGDRSSGFIEEGYLGIKSDQGGRLRLRNIRIGPARGAVRVRSMRRADGFRARLVPDLRKGRLFWIGPDGAETTLDGKRLNAYQ